jgi:hypothetical protein
VKDGEHLRMTAVCAADRLAASLACGQVRRPRKPRLNVDSHEQHQSRSVHHPA